MPKKRTTSPTRTTRGSRAAPSPPGWLTLSAVAAATVVAYYGSLSGDFIWDDRILILEGQLPRAWGRLREILTSDFFARSEFDVVYGYYRPLATLSYLWDYELWGLRPWGYHLTNLSLHLANGALIAMALRRWGWSQLGAASAALLFAVHPIHSENVAWIAGRTDPLAMLLVMVAVVLESRPVPDKKTSGKSKAAPAIAWSCFALALLAKETAVVALPWLWLVHLLHHRRSAANATIRLIPYLAILAVYLVWRLAIIEVRGPLAPPLQTPANILLSLGPTAVRYLGWLVLPLEQVAYAINPYVTTITDPRLWIAWPILAAVALAIHRLARAAGGQRVWLATALLLAAMVPNLNFIRPSSPMDMGATMAERFCYFPSFPFLALVGLVFELWLGGKRRWSVRVAGGLALGITLSAATAATIARNRAWSDELTFLQDTLAKSPRAALLWGRLADYHLERRDLEAATEAIARAEALDADAEQVLSARAYMEVLRGHPERAIAIQERLVQGARLGRGPARNNLAYLYRITGRLAQARSLLEQLVKENRAYSDVYANLAEIERAEGDLAAARRDYHLALRDRPDDLQVAGALVALEVETGHPEAAEAVYRNAMEHYPDDPRLLNNIAMIRAGAGNLDGALAILADLILRHPRYPSARVNYAQVLYRSGRRREAKAQLRAARPLVAGTELEQVVSRQLQEWGEN